MRTSKIVATLGAASILATGAFMPVADARVVSGNDKNIAADSVDTTRAISLLVKKRATNPYDDVPAGQKRPAIEGAIFVLSRVNDIDVTTEEGREDAKNLTMEQVREKGLGVVDKKTTNASGAVQFTGLSAGLYLLEEQAPDDDHEYHVSSPQLIILPLGDVKGERFTYENVVVTKWDDDGGLTPTTTPTPTPGTSTPATTEPTTKTTPTTRKTTPPGSTVTTVTTPVKTTLTTTRADGSTTVVTTRTNSVTTVTKPGDNTRGGDLASTGANVLWAAGLGGLLILIGFVLARRSKNEEQTR